MPKKLCFASDGLICLRWIVQKATWNFSPLQVIAGEKPWMKQSKNTPQHWQRSLFSKCLSVSRVHSEHQPTPPATNKKGAERSEQQPPRCLLYSGPNLRRCQAPTRFTGNREELPTTIAFYSHDRSEVTHKMNIFVFLYPDEVN